MAAWSDHAKLDWELLKNRETYKVSTPDATPPEPFPLEVWTFFSDADLDQLVVDACAEMGRRELAKMVADNA